MSNPVHTTAVPAEFVSTKPASQSQLAYIGSLRTKKVLSPEHQEWIDGQIDQGMSRRQASLIIERLRALKQISVLSNAIGPMVSVANGHYALRTPGDEINPIKFYRVNTPTEGRWVGHTFVKRYSSDEEMPVRGAMMRRVLSDIAKDPIAASKLYGTETCRCGVCNRKLTTAESRAYGIGPECREKMGW